MRRTNSNNNNNDRNRSRVESTINAAANAIGSTHTLAYPQNLSSQKRRWRSFWGVYWCFGSHKNKKRVRHAALFPEPAASQNNVSVSHNLGQVASTRSLPFVAPPSSPVSFLQSETPSAMQSPASSLPPTAVSDSMFSPGGPSSIFAIGPYAHEIQLVSPPVFSTYTTEPSTAPFTPPPESIQLTTPSSPEVPIAQLLDLNLRNGETNRTFLSAHYEFNSYQFQPGSPVGQLISPSSGISGSGTSSPYPDREYAVTGSQFLEFWKGDRSNLFTLDKMSAYDWGSRQGSGTLTPNSVRPKSLDEFPLDHPPNLLRPDEAFAEKFKSRPSSGILTLDVITPRSRDDFPLDLAPNLLDFEDSSPRNCDSGGSNAKTNSAVQLEHHDHLAMDCQDSVMTSHKNTDNDCENAQVAHHRVSFELTLEDVARCVEKKPPVSSHSILTSIEDFSDTERELISWETTDVNKCKAIEMANEKPENTLSNLEESGEHQKHTVSLGSAKDFNFIYADGADSIKPIANSDWWSNEKVVDEEHQPIKKWSFFPMLQPGVS